MLAADMKPAWHIQEDEYLTQSEEIGSNERAVRRRRPWILKRRISFVVICENCMTEYYRLGKVKKEGDDL